VVGAGCKYTFPKIINHCWQTKKEKSDSIKLISLLLHLWQSNALAQADDCSDEETHLSCLDL
jgi:hypothetical protein